MTIKEKKTYKKILSSCIVLSMILTGFATMFIVSGPVENVSAVETNYSPPSLRIYGEENAMYPTHSVMDQGHAYAQDFIYLNAVDPFDPGVLSKDSVTFNPAIIDMVYNGEEIKVDGVNSKEKVFLRTFYEPGYYHPPDSKMDATESVGDFDAVITETTYCLITHDNKPVAGAPGSTKFILPYESTDPDNPGMEHAGRVTLKNANRRNWKDGGGEIWVEKQFTDIPKNGTVNFMDHRLKFIRYEDGYNPYKAAVDVSYEGNMYGAHNDSVRNYLEEGVTYYFDRNNEDYTSSHATHRWYAKINFMCDDHIDVTVGRHLVGGETFYVDGVRYDMPAVHVIYENGEDRFKYITFQSPLPKCETQMWYQNDPATTEDEVELNVMDWSHVSSQWLANLLPNTQGMQGYPENYVWMLPPFNEDHTMIDDIGLIKHNGRIPAGGIEILGQKDELEFCYIEEAKEERFDTSLAERLHIEDCTYNEEWLWSSVYTKPNRYTTFILPNQETINDQYDPDTLDEYDYPYTTADGNEYLVTSSFLAPNSDPNYLRDWNTDDSWYTPPYDAHQIYDRVLNAISHEYGNDERAEFQGWPRLVFEYDAVEGTDFFVNENDDGVNNDVSLRVYGEEDYKYPTHSWSQQSYDAYGEWWQFVQNYAPWGYSSITDIGGDFIYPSHQYAFDPGAIPKDSITFNPAMIDMYYQGDRLILNGNDGREKVHLRAFYEPGFTHGPDTKMSEYYSLEPVEEFDAVVLETTYMPITVDNEPVACQPAMVEHRDPEDSMDFYPDDGGQNTKFILPYKSTDANKPGMEEAGRVVLVNADSGSNNPIDGFQDCDVLTDGSIVVAKKFESIPKEGDSSRSFMDHTFTFETYRMDYQDVKVKVSYDGNMYDAHSGTETQYLYEDQVYWFDRNNQKQTSSDEAHRWFVNIEFMCDDYVDVWIGRKLVAGETFYVDGVRYDIPAIAVEPSFVNVGGEQTTSVNPDSDYGFKYLTLQTPLPKCTTQMWFNDDLDDNVNDWSHVSSQWLANLLPNKQGYQGYPNNFAWVLPPFNHVHIMIDDIGLIKEDMGYSGCPDWEIPASGIRLDDEKPKLQFSYVEETTEERFITTLAERLATKWFYYPNEKWTWWNSYSNPIQYTEFILPDQETTNDPYHDQDPGLIRWEQKHNEPYPHTHADGSEYLYTSSLGAPNCEESDYWALSKYSKEAHDITDVLDKKMRDVIRQDRMGEGVEWTFGPHEDNWCIGDFSNCGEGNNLRFWWLPSFVGKSYATVGPIDTTDHLYEWLTFEFVHTVDHYWAVSGYTLGVEYSYDGSNWNTLETWTPTDNMNCQLESYPIYVEYHDQIYLRFFFDGDNYEINWWNIDSVVLKHDNSALFYDGFESQPEVPRLSFEFDADESTGIYLNEMNPVHTIEANDDAAETTWNNCVDINVLGNDIGDGKQVISTTEGQILSNGKIRYCALSGSGTDTATFEYTIEDDYGQTDTATVTVTINDNPNTIEAVDDNAKTGWDECIIIDVLDNDEGQELKITSVTNPTISGATTEIVSGTIRYCVPDGSGSDTDTFDYTIEDEDENTDTATVTVHITDTAIFVQQISVPLNTCLGCEEWNRVTIDSDDAVGRVSLNITWNPDHIHVSEVQQNDMDWDYWPGFDDSTLDNGYINITAMNTKDGVTGEGIEIIRLKMSDGPQAAAGQTYPVNVEWCVVKDTTIPPIELPVTVYPGSVSILGEPQYIPGDMDADNDQTQDDLDVDDLYVMARIVFDELEPLSGTDGDLDEDGDVDIDDLFILAVWVFN